MSFECFVSCFVSKAATTVLLGLARRRNKRGGDRSFLGGCDEMVVTPTSTMLLSDDDSIVSSVVLGVNNALLAGEDRRLGDRGGRNLISKFGIGKDSLLPNEYRYMY